MDEAEQKCILGDSERYQILVHLNLASLVVIVRVSTAGIKHHYQKQLGEERVGYTHKADYTTSLMEVKSGTQGRKAEAMEECCLPLCLFCHCILRLLLYTIQDDLPRDSTTHSGMGHPISTVNQENAPQTSL